jgi:protein involved in polysaccharide export with SLBB domain
MTSWIRLWRAAKSLVGLTIALAAPATAADYRIMGQEKLRIKVQEWPALSDEVAVTDTGAFTLPVVGSLQSLGRNTSEIADEISERLQKTAKLDERPFTSVEVSQFRPIYVLGDVQRPGEYNYRPGLTVLASLSLSGGVYRMADSPLLRDMVVGNGSISTLQSQRREMAVKRARLIAELNGTDRIEVDAAAVGGVSLGEAVEQERAIMQARSRLLGNQIAALRKENDIRRDEIKFSRARMESTIKQLASVEKELAGLRSLNERGLALAPRQTTLERLAAQIEGDQRAIDTQIAQAQAITVQNEAAITRLGDDRRREAQVELRQVTAQIEQLEGQLASQRALLAVAGALGVAEDAQSNRAQFVLTYQISRGSGAAVREVTVAESDLVEPGDVIKVVRRVVGPSPVLGRSEPHRQITPSSSVAQSGQ